MGVGPAAPHQNQTLRRAEEEAANEQAHSPHVGKNGTYPDESDFFDDNDDQNGQHDIDHGSGGDSEEGEYGDQDAEDDLDDDMMDKISSSPSIDDGKYTLPIWPRRSNSFEVESLLSLSSTPPRVAEDSSSSPFTSPPQHFPLLPYEEISKAKSVNHHQGGYRSQYCAPRTTGLFTIASGHATHDDAPTKPKDHEDRTKEELNGSRVDMDETIDSGTDMSLQEIEHFLLPVDDPLLEDAISNLNKEVERDESDLDDGWEDMDEMERSECDSDEDDDTQDFSTDDPRFIDSGWGGECLRDPEDIDFEFVYALHTFVATVEGQANATKGDTMVLLDDSNSYWWLVRVVKDGSIGMTIKHMRLKRR